jgi:hypothetical protein
MSDFVFFLHRNIAFPTFKPEVHKYLSYPCKQILADGVTDPAYSNDLWQVIQAKLENVGPQLLAGGSTSTDTLWPSTRCATRLLVFLCGASQMLFASAMPKAHSLNRKSPHVLLYTYNVST